MIAALLLLASAPTAVDAERAFAAAAKRDGQWTAFRATASEDAIMFAPGPVNARSFLADRKDPPAALHWAPSHSFVSCDGSVAVNTGPWSAPGGKGHGYFTTVWRRQPDGGWKWVLDAGDALAKPRPPAAAVTIRSASCKGKPPSGLANARGEAAAGAGTSGDATLIWHWAIAADGARTTRVALWNGSAYEQVLADDVAAPPK